MQNRWARCLSPARFLSVPRTHARRARTARAQPEELAALVDHSCYERWERLTLQKTLDGMADLVYCPKCETPTLEDGADHFAQCAAPSCGHTWCALCQGEFHPGVECLSAEDTVRVLQSRAAGNRRAGQAEREKHERALKEAMNLVAVRPHPQPAGRARSGWHCD